MRFMIPITRNALMITAPTLAPISIEIFVRSDAMVSNTITGNNAIFINALTTIISLNLPIDIFFTSLFNNNRNNKDTNYSIAANFCIICLVPSQMLSSRFFTSFISLAYTTPRPFAFLAY